MKAQLTLEFMVSFIIFILFIVFIYSQFSSNIPYFIEEIEKENKRSKAYQISELLLNDPGEPANWDNPSLTKRIGLSYHKTNQTNLLFSQKIISLNSYCNSNYLEFKRRFGVEENFTIKFNQIDNDGTRNTLLFCKPPQFETTQVNATFKRITSYYDSSDDRIKLGELIVEV
ncbi:MAG: hypothetical protein QXY45_02630 [Candidatus Aenigmatarchaeota archaeon]